MDAELRRGSRFRMSFAAAYAAMIGGSVAIFLLIRGYGETLTAPAPALPATALGADIGPAPNALLHVLLALAAVIVVVATTGKFGGTLAAARLTGMDWRDAMGLGVLLNTRGLMQLVVLNIDLDLHVISPILFTMMVLMAPASTVATTPVLQLLGVEGTRTFVGYNRASRSVSKW